LTKLPHTRSPTTFETFLPTHELFSHHALIVEDAAGPEMHYRHSLS
jgi:hypothetical protein